MMPRNLTILALAVLSIGGSSEAAAQEPTVAQNGGAAEIGGRLRSFYFNLVHNNWEALTADILAAKVVAHRPPPENLVLGQGAPARDGLSRAGAASSAPDSVCIDQSVIRIEGDWAEVTVPHCAPLGGRDEFRLILFDGRWRFVSVHLFEQPANAMVGR